MDPLANLDVGCRVQMHEANHKASVRVFDTVQATVVYTIYRYAFDCNVVQLVQQACKSIEY